MYAGYSYDDYDGYDDAYEEYSFPPLRNIYDGFDSYGSDVCGCGFDDEDYLDMEDVCSSSDCTGMMVSGPGADEELRAYQDMYKFGVPKDQEI